MLRRCVPLIVTLVAACLLSGCSKPEKRYIGKWTFDPESSIPEKLRVAREEKIKLHGDTALTNEQEEEIKQEVYRNVADSIKQRLGVEITDDHRFKLLEKDEPDEEGVWLMEGELLVLVPMKKEEGMRVTGEITDGRLRIKVTDGDRQMSMFFQREPK